MAFQIPNVNPYILIQSRSSLSSSVPINVNPSSSPLPVELAKGVGVGVGVGVGPTLLKPPVLGGAVGGAHVKEPPTTTTTSTSPSDNKNNNNEKDEFYVNLGQAVRSLREDLPQIFTKDLNYHIYRDDVTFIDPLNTFSGIEKYKLIFWALRFHGRILFKQIDLQVLRIWQPSENMILIRWNLRGTPRVPWEANGEFQGTSRYKLDRKGKIYEHKVDNLAFNFPQPLKPAASVLDLVTACPASPNLSFLWGPADLPSSSWVEFYRVVKETLDHEGTSVAFDGFVTC